MYSDVSALTLTCVTTALPLVALSEMTSVSIHALNLQYTRTVQLGDSEAGLNISFCFLTLKAGLTLPAAPFVNITHDSVKGQQNSLPCSFHVYFSHVQLRPVGAPSRSLPADSLKGSLVPIGLRLRRNVKTPSSCCLFISSAGCHA